MSDLNCLSYWFPKLQASGVSVPKTTILRTDCELSSLLDGVMPAGYDDFMAHLQGLVKAMGLPCFLRTGQTSNKHNWSKSCCLADLSKLPEHVVNLVEFSALTDFMGLPCDVWVVRELLPTQPICALPCYGGMPLVREFRCFVRDGKVQCVHPYWPRQAIAEGFIEDASDDFVQQCYERSGGGVQPARVIDPVLSLAARVAVVFPGYWSVDVLDTANGWYVTDMAEGDRSFHWPDCQHCPDEMRKRYAARP